MVLRFLLASAFVLETAFAQGSASTVEIIPELTQEETRKFVESALLESEQTIPIDVPARALVIQYSADAPFELWVSFPTREPFTGSDGVVGINPLHVLKAKLQPLEGARISLDLTGSPAWYAGRRSFVLHVLGQEGAVVRIAELTALQPTFLDSFKSYAKQFFLDEPVLLSSINFLHGYQIANSSVVLVFGSLLLIACIVTLFIPKRRLQVILLLSLAGILLYDARVSLDLARVTAKDLTEWWGEGEYRQLGPLHLVADYLKEERKEFGSSMRLVMCFDGTDLLQKQLRYLLYPTPVLRPEEGWDQATHAVFMDTDRGKLERGIASCGEEFVRPGELLREFSGRTRIIRFLSPP